MNRWLGIAVAALAAVPQSCSGSTDAGEAERADQVAARKLTIDCAPEGVTINSESVIAGRAGVTLVVSSAVPPGTYLNFTFDGGGFGEPVPSAATLTRPLPPGKVTVSCSNLKGGVSETSLVFTVTDPDSQWRATTLDQLGCAFGAIPSWTVHPGHGTTSGSAVGNLLDHFGSATTEPDMTAAQAAIGYPDASPQTWLLNDQDERPRITVLVYPRRKHYAALPNYRCA